MDVVSRTSLTPATIEQFGFGCGKKSAGIVGEQKERPSISVVVDFGIHQEGHALVRLAVYCWRETKNRAVLDCTCLNLDDECIACVVWTAVSHLGTE